MRLAALLLALAGCSGFKATTPSSSVPDEADGDVDADADADGDADGDVDSDADADGDTDPTTALYRHTIVVDGSVGDFVSGEEGFANTGGTTFVAWDANALYVGVQHGDVGLSPEHWVVVTLGNHGPGTTTGAAFNTQEPALSFEASHVVRWKADDSYNSLLSWSGGQWVETAFWLGTNGSEHVSNFATDQSEVKIPFSALGITGAFDLHVSWVFEGSGYESTYAPTPAASFTDGYDPDYTRWYTFDSDGAQVPTAYAVQGGGGTVVETAVTGDTGGATGDTGVVTGDTGAPPSPFAFTPTVDGALGDWPGTTQFGTSAGTITHIGWDAAAIYLGVDHPDVLTGGPEHWLVAYLGNGGAGSTTGLTFNTQTPGLPFAATAVARWKADDSYSSLETWNGSGWDSTTPYFGVGAADRAESGTVVELAIPLADVGVGTTFDLWVGWVFEGAGNETTYAATPAGSIADGYDPDYGQYWQFDRASPLGPTSYTPQP